MARWLLPQGVDPEASLLLVARALRALGDGYMAVLLPAYLLTIGLDTLQVGIVSTATMLGSALTTLAVGAWGHRFASNRLLLCAAVLMVATGMGFASLSSFWPLLVVAFVGTLNPSSGDVSVFLPLEHARLARAARANARTALFARYSVLGALCAAFGALAAGLPDWLARDAGVTRLAALRGMFVVYGVLGLTVFWLYRRLPEREESRDQEIAAPLGPSRASSCAWRPCSAWMPLPVAWWSIRCFRCSCSNALACRWRRPAPSSSWRECSAPPRSSPRRWSRGALAC